MLVAGTELVYEGPIISGATLGGWKRTRTDPAADDRAMMMRSRTLHIDLPIKARESTEELQARHKQATSDLRAAEASADPIAIRDATALARLRAAGAVIVGTTNMVEFAYGGAEHNDAYGPPKNPWGLNHLTGGSSSGSGAAVAAGSVPIALGSDTAGSVRAPASLNGLTGHKPTYGLVSRFGVTPLSWSMDNVGPLARTAEDVAISMNVLAGHDPRDGASARHAKEDYVAALRAALAGVRIGVLQDDYIWDVVEPEVKTAFDQAVRRIASILSHIHIRRCRRSHTCRSRWSPYH